ncbi:DUF4224 domain-containing protein [Ferrovum sp.]|uniref:DUF4224 domain-containing protein n=1 Tax=Ferrovum sp. TaxID=2609467 RepID=UPI00344FB19F
MPPEFFSIPELQTLSGAVQRARIIGWLASARVLHVVGLHGWPMVYRTNLLPDAKQEAQNGGPTFDFTAAYAPTSRKAQNRRAS